MLIAPFFSCLLLVQTPEAQRQLADALVVAKQGPGTQAGRAAWERLVQDGPVALPTLLKFMDSPDVVRANWLRTAFDRIVENELTKRPVQLQTAPLLLFAENPKHEGRARRLALEVVEQLQPGTTNRLLAGWLEDPEFRHEAVDLKLAEGQRLLKEKRSETARPLLLQAFQSSRELQQARRAQSALEEVGVKVSTARHLGFLMDWHLVGPFDSKGNQGFMLQYPPEKGVDLQAEYTGQTGKVKWKPYQVQEPPAKLNAKHVALVNLRETRALGDADDAVAFAYTEIVVQKPQRVEFRGAADDNFTVFVNGKKEFGFEEYRNGVRFDRHRFAANLKAGKNTVLVKVCQTPAPNPEPNWEFLLRVVDVTGRGIEMETSTVKGENR